MTARTSTCTQLRVVLDASSPRGVLAAEVLAAEAGLTLAEAARRLSDAPCDLSAGLSAGRARRLVRSLSLFGVRTHVEPVDGPRQRPALRFDLALQWVCPTESRAVIDTLAAELGRPSETVAQDFSSPTGLLVEGLDWSAVSVWRQTVQRVRGLRLVVSDPQAALYDLLPSRDEADSLQAVALLVHLRRLGIAPCPLTGAVGAGLDHVMRDHVRRRFPQAGFMPVNRDFQRFDLLLTGVSGLDAGEIEGFLRTRGGLGRALDRNPDASTGPSDPLRIECALGRADALAFQSDYAAIGIDTRLRLVWPHAARMS